MEHRKDQKSLHVMADQKQEKTATYFAITPTPGLDIDMVIAETDVKQFLEHISHLQKANGGK